MSGRGCGRGREGEVVEWERRREVSECMHVILVASELIVKKETNFFSHTIHFYFILYIREIKHLVKHLLQSKYMTRRILPTERKTGINGTYSTNS